MCFPKSHSVLLSIKHMIFQAWIGKILMRREMCFHVNQIWHISFVHEYFVRDSDNAIYYICDCYDCYHVWTNSVLLPFKIPETFPNGVYSTRYRFLCAMTVCPDPVFYVSARVRACMCLNVWTVGWLMTYSITTNNMWLKVPGSEGRRQNRQNILWF